MIRLCSQRDLDTLFSIINDAARAYKGIIPGDRWKEPYMPIQELEEEIEEGVEFWGEEKEGDLTGVMGIQDRGEVTLIRHAYVRTTEQGRGVGRRLLAHLETLTDTPLLVGTWVNAHWAVKFYERNGYRVTSRAETQHLLRTYWSIPDRQVETSVVLQKDR